MSAQIIIFPRARARTRARVDVEQRRLVRQERAAIVQLYPRTRRLEVASRRDPRWPGGDAA
jgi:hypothetical protein